MRIPSKFGERSNNNIIKREKSKIYLMFEGEKTEVQYFNALIDQLKRSNNLIFETVPLLRSFNQRTHSHPNNIVSQIEKFKKDRGQYKYLNDILIDYLIYELKICDNKYNENEIIENVNSICSNIMTKHKPNDKISVEEVLEYLTEILDSYFSTEKQIEHFIEYLNNQTTFALYPDDRICLVIDGDHKSVIQEDNYIKLVQLAQNLNIELYVSKPNFEFWLLLHSKNISKYNNEELLANKKINKNKKFLEKVLSLEFEGYDKSRIKAERFIPLIDVALKQSKNYCEDLCKLNKELGSNVGSLIRSIKKEDK